MCMKSKKVKWLSLLLACLLLLGCIPAPALAQGGEAFDETAYHALADSLYDGAPGAGSAALVGALKHLLESGGGYVEGKGWDTLWGWIFGTDDTNQQIIESLNRIEGKLDEIIRQLGNLKNILKERALEDRITQKMMEMDAANTPLKRAITEFERAPTLEQKMKALDIWVEYNPKGFKNAFYFFENYCDRVAGTTTYEKTSAFALYDTIADLKWNFDHDGAAFRQMQRDADVHFVTRMASMLLLWLQRESQDGGGYISKYTPEELEMFRRMLNEGLQKVIAACEAYPVRVREDVRGFHAYSGDQRISFDIYIGEPAPGETPKTYSLHRTLVDTLRQGKTVNDVEAAVQGLIAGDIPFVKDYAGERFTLINKGALTALDMAAKDRKITIRELLQGVGMRTGDGEYVIYSSAEKENMPVHFGEGKTLHGPIARRIDVNIACFASKEPWFDTFLGQAHVLGNSGKLSVMFGPGHFMTPFVYPALLEMNGHISLKTEKESFFAIWIANGQNIPVIDDPKTESLGDAALEANVRVDSVADGVISGVYAEMDAVPAMFRIDAQTELPEGMAQDDLPGKTVRIAYEELAADEEAWRAGAPALRAVRVSLTGPADDDPAGSIEGTVVRIESAAQIIGGTEDLVVEAEGREHVFDLTEETVMDDGIAPGMTVRVDYHGDARGIRHADTVTVTGINPVPAPEIIEGIITGLARAEMPGGQGTLTLAIPGGSIALQLPAAIAADGLREGMTVRVAYHTQDGAHIVDGIEVIGNPSPDDTNLVAEGLVTRCDVAAEIVGRPPVIFVAVPGGEVEISAPNGLPDTLEVGVLVHVHYHVADGVNVADRITVNAPLPEPTPVPQPVSAWVEGYVLQRLDDVAQQRELVVSAAGQNYTLCVPEWMTLAEDVREGAFVHVDYAPQPDGRNMIGGVWVMQPAPQPVDGPTPGPVDDPMPGPLPTPADDPMPGPVYPVLP